jgi:hypothetical protein
MWEQLDVHMRAFIEERGLWTHTSNWLGTKNLHNLIRLMNVDFRGGHDCLDVWLGS